MPKLDNVKMEQKYIRCMEEIKKRTEVVRSIVERELHVKYDVTTAETAALQIRKILELIALSSLVANYEKYREKRANFHKDWHAKRILETLESVNPNFFPQPKNRHAFAQGKWKLYPVDSDFLTRSDLVELYDRCSALLHAENPFDNGDEKRDQKKFLYQEIPTWMHKIITLLKHHTVQPVDEDRMYIFTMQAEDGKPHMAEFARNERGWRIPGCRAPWRWCR